MSRDEQYVKAVEYATKASAFDETPTAAQVQYARLAQVYATLAMAQAPNPLAYRMREGMRAKDGQ